MVWYCVVTGAVNPVIMEAETRLEAARKFSRLSKDAPVTIYSECEWITKGETPFDLIDIDH